MCMRKCEEAFPNVVDSEKSCSATVSDIHRELVNIKLYLQTKHGCRGRFRTACNEWKGEAVRTLDRLIGLTLDHADCNKLDSRAIGRELGIFDPATACKGDRIVTDFHDSIAGSDARILALNEVAGRYTFANEPFLFDKDYQGHRPICDEGHRPRATYVWPALEFLFALEAVETYQRCTSKCDKPTPTQELLWQADDRFIELEEELARLEAEERAFSQVPADQGTAAAVDMAYCGPLAEVRIRLSELRASFDHTEHKLRSLVQGGGPRADEVVAIRAEVNELAGPLEGFDWVLLRQQCGDENKLATELNRRRLAVVETIHTGDDFSLKAAETFTAGGGEGQGCTWIWDCGVPLSCIDGQCVGTASLGAIRSLLDQATELKARAVSLPVRADSGLTDNAAKEVAILEEECDQLRLKLTELGWGLAVAGWRTEFKTALEARFAELGASLDRAEGELGELADDADSACKADHRRSAKRLRGLRGDLDHIRKALGSADPMESPNWITIRLADLDKVDAGVKEVRGELSQLCSTSESSEIPWWMYVVATVLLACLAGAALFVLRKKVKGRKLT